MMMNLMMTTLRSQRRTCSFTQTPPRLPQQPIRQRHKLSRPIPSIRLIRMLNRMSRNSTLLIKREDEQTFKTAFFSRQKNGCVAA
jgi:hypothetical protein